MKPEAAAAARNSVKRLKTLRHPRILRYLDSFVDEAGGRILLATERVVPLLLRLEELRKDPEWLIWTAYLLMHGLAFLHSQGAQIIHGNVRLASLAITKGGEVRLGGFEVASAIREDDSLLASLLHKTLPLIDSREWPPECTSSYSAMSWRQMRDFLIGDLLLLSFCRDALQEDPLRRPAPANFLQSAVGHRTFSGHSIIQVSEQTEALSGLTLSEQSAFYEKCLGRLDQIPSAFAQFSLLPRLVQLQQLPDGLPLPGIKLALRIASSLDPAEVAMINPLIVNLLQRQDRATRLMLLEEMSPLLNSLNERLLMESVWPVIQSSSLDTQPALRALCLRTLAGMASRLPARLLATEGLRLLNKLILDDQPGIRVNACITLGRVAPLLDPASRSKHLLMALCRACHDPFAPARQAALTALEAGMMTLYTMEERARSILPAICPLCIDPERQVREEALRLTAELLNVLRQHSSQMPDFKPVEMQPSTKSPPPAAPSESAWSKWAIDSLTTRLVSTALGEHAKLEEQAKVREQAMGPNVKEMANLRLQSPPSSSQAKDGWDQDDDLDNLMEIEVQPANITGWDEEDPWAPPATTNSVRRGMKLGAKKF